MCGQATNTIDCPANPARETRAKSGCVELGPANVAERLSGMDEDMKLQFPSLPATKEELLVSSGGRAKLS